jgi:hypothetical protein
MNFQRERFFSGFERLLLDAPRTSSRLCACRALPWPLLDSVFRLEGVGLGGGHIGTWTSDPSAASESSSLKIFDLYSLAYCCL